jgi:ATP-dependent exoDNAse (exonuclease V) beta subunit
VKNPHDAIKFDQAAHTYRLGRVQLSSVSSVLKRLKPEFDRERISQRCAAKRGITQAAILAEWDKTRDDALAKGTLLHSCIEATLCGRPIPPHRALPELAYWQDWWLGHKMRYTPRKTEYVVGSLELGIAGTMDALMVDQDTAQLAVLDWKTGKEFRTSNQYGERLLAPFQDLDNCEQETYSLQVSLYRLLLERDGYTPSCGGGLIVHLTNRAAVEHVVTDYRSRLLAWLNHE